MTAHELAKKLLEGPDMLVVTRQSHCHHSQGADEHYDEDVDVSNVYRGYIFGMPIDEEAIIIE